MACGAWPAGLPRLAVRTGNLPPRPDEIAGGHASVPHTTPVGAQPLSVARLEWEHIQRVIAECDGNISETARRLNMHRRSLQRKLAMRPVRR